ncbi:M48 family metallopeptidase [Bacteroides uniformis]|nr:M48 family metallopeptidase [Bacteroides uniformis]
MFSKLNATTIDSNRGESLNIRIIQSPEPDAFMLPNGSMVISTGLLCTLDSEDELAAVIACELGHFVLDHRGKQHLPCRAACQACSFLGRCLCHYRQCSPRCGLLGR